MPSKTVWRALACLVSCFLMGLQLWSADVTGRIRGTVTDPSGAVVVGANVTATNAQTGIAYSATSNSTGAYEFLQLPVGTYNISATAPGFQTFSASGITINIDQVYVQNIGFKVGEGTQTVEVQANAVQVDTTNMQLNNVVEAKQIVDLPLIGRNWTQLELIQPGVQPQSDRFGTFSVNGAQTQQTSFLINGTDINDLPLNTAQYTPSPDALSQFNLVTSSLNPEYSRNSGAIVSASIKNGTNHYHGDAFEFYRDTFLNTHNFFQQTAPKFHQHIFGGTLGGPVLKDKAFFFASYQGTRSVSPQAGGNVTVFSAAQLGTSGGTANWSTLASGAAFNLSTRKIPGTLLTQTGCAAGSTWRSCFQPGGAGTPVLIPTSAFNPLALKLVQQYVPLPNSAKNTFLFNPQTTTTGDQGIARLDGNVTSKDQLWGVVVIEKRPSADTLPFTGATLPGFGDVNTRDTHQFTASWTHEFNANTLNEFRLGYSRFNFGAVEPAKIVTPSSAGFAINPQHPQVAGFPRIGITGFFNLGFSNNGPQPRVDQNYQADDNFSKIAGNHSLKFGFDGRRFNVNNPFFGNNNGNYAFSSANPFGTGNAGLDFLFGTANSYAQGGGGSIDAYAYEWYPYAQDVWKARDNLTVTYGLGWQVDTALHNRQLAGVGVICYVPGEQSKVFPTAPKNLVYPGDPGCNDAQGSKTQWKDFGPRFGFAYAPDLGFLSGGSSHKLSIRGGYGIYYNRTEEEGSLQNLGQPPYAINSTGAGHYVPGARPVFANPFQDINTGQVFANQFPAPVVQPGQNVDFSPFEPFVSSLSSYAPSYRAPYAQNFNLTLQRELPSNIVLTVSYVGSLGRHEQSVYNPDPITPAGHAACLADPVNCGGTSAANPSPNIDNQAEAFPNHVLNNDGDIFASPGFIASGASSNYNSLQISATKGLTHGLLFQASYTWSHALDTASSFENSGFASGNGATFRGYNQFQPSLNYGDSQFDVRHRFVFSPVYEVPFRHNGLLGKVLGGWEISGILSLQTGFPFDISYAGNVSYSLWCAAGENFYACPDVPNQVAPLQLANPRTGGASGSNWFTPGNSFTDEVIGQFGNIHRNSYHGPGIVNADAGIYKNVYLGSDNNRYIQLRLESYNIFNHTNFNNPVTDFTSSQFGRITSAAAGRQSQLAAKFYF